MSRVGELLLILTAKGRRSPRKHRCSYLDWHQWKLGKDLRPSAQSTVTLSKLFSRIDSTCGLMWLKGVRGASSQASQSVK